MPQFSQNKCSYLAYRIHEELSKGIRPDPELLHYIQSTFDCNTSQELADIINDIHHCEREPLLELLLFPDQDMQIALEADLEAGTFVLEDQHEILRHLMQLDLQVPLYLEQDHYFLTIMLPEEVALKCIHRLQIQHHLDISLRTLIESIFEHKKQLIIKAKLRHKRIVLNEVRVDCLKKFLTHYAQFQDIFWEYFDFVLHLLEEYEPQTAIHEALVQKKVFLERTLFQAKRQDQMLLKDNMETLMLQGQRVLCINQAFVLRSLEIIDDLALRLFGHIPHRPEASSFLDLKSDYTLSEFHRIFDFLNQKNMD